MKITPMQRAVCKSLKIPPWVAGLTDRPGWPTRAWYWIRGYR